jgi:hypothetical protein
MSHNLHFVAVKADSPEDACNEVENQILDWGTENNWRTICGCVSEKDEIYINDNNGRWQPDAPDFNSIKKINERVTEWIKTPSYYSTPAKEMLAKEPDLTKWPKHELWSLMDYTKYLYEICGIDKENVDVFEIEFYHYDFGENGVTNIGGDGETRYIVFVDMHT